ncbi:DUF3313 domain-containing protein [Edwardsiella tarda]|uniref:DUF3313 domain-containing protein n=1 Tax=Edwardsiella tarda TaxID=636 RepID=UPI00351C83E7
MKRLRLKTLGCIALPACLLLAGCASTVPSKDQYGNYFTPYENVTRGNTASGQQVLYWRAPGIDMKQFNSLIYQPVIYAPRPKPTAQISQSTLDQILAYTNQQVKAALASHYPLVDKPTGKTLIFRGAITAIDTQKQGVQFYEVLPVTLLIAGTQAATGHRTLDSAVYLQAEFIDAATHKPVLKVVRKISGNPLRNEQTPLRLQDMQPALNALGKDIRAFNGFGQ